MESHSLLPTFSVLWILCIFAFYVAYLTLLAIYRLYFHPLSRFPGPKLAALTPWYEFYYDVILDGNFHWQLQKLHTRYGSVAQIL